jgi:hypothetical protein
LKLPLIELNVSGKIIQHHLTLFRIFYSVAFKNINTDASLHKKYGM